MQFRSKFEEQVAKMLAGVGFEYESQSFPYILECKYTPDFILDNGIIIEVKGYHPEIKQALRKLRAVKSMHPELDIRIVWQSDIKLGKIIKASSWSVKYGFPYSIGVIPKEWLKERK